MKHLWFHLLAVGGGLAADRKAASADPALASAFKERYLALTDSWVREIEFTSAETAAMKAGKQWEAAMRQGPDDPMGKRILAAGEPTFGALASPSPGQNPAPTGPRTLSPPS